MVSRDKMVRKLLEYVAKRKYKTSYRNLTIKKQGLVRKSAVRLI